MLKLPVQLGYPQLFTVLAVAFLLIGVFFAVFWLYFVTIEKILARIKAKEALTQEQSYQKALRVLEDAKKQAFKLTQDASVRAKKILDEASTFTQESKNLMAERVAELQQKQNAVLEGTTQAFLDVYKKALATEKQEGLEVIKDISEDIKEEATTEISEFGDALRKETVESQDLVRERIDAEYKRVQQELAEYRTKQYALIDKHVYAILARVTQDVLGSPLNLEGQQEVVLSALKAAKESGRFDDA